MCIHRLLLRRLHRRLCTAVYLLLLQLRLPTLALFGVGFRPSLDHADFTPAFAFDFLRRLFFYRLSPVFASTGAFAKLLLTPVVFLPKDCAFHNIALVSTTALSPSASLACQSAPFRAETMCSTVLRCFSHHFICSSGWPVVPLSYLKRKINLD